MNLPKLVLLKHNSHLVLLNTFENGQCYILILACSPIVYWNGVEFENYAIILCGPDTPQGELEFPSPVRLLWLLS